MRETLTPEEKEKILRACFKTLDPPVLKQYTNKPGKKPAVLEQAARAFEPGKHYTEREITQALGRVWEDPILLRRDMVEYGVLSRTRDGRDYWLTEEEK